MGEKLERLERGIRERNKLEKVKKKLIKVQKKKETRN